MGSKIIRANHILAPCFRTFSRCSSLLLCLAALNLLKSILLTSVLLSLFGSKYRSLSDCEDDPISERSERKARTRHSKGKQRVVKTKRNYPRVQSEISLSTISEEPQSEAQHHSHDLKVDLSIRCY